MSEKIKYEILTSRCGVCLVVNGMRVAGSKPLGGGTVERTFRGSKPDIVKALGIADFQSKLSALETENTRLSEIQYHLAGDKERYRKDIIKLEEKINGFEGAVLEPLQEKYKFVTEQNALLQLQLDSANEALGKIKENSYPGLAVKESTLLNRIYRIAKQAKEEKE